MTNKKHFLRLFGLLIATIVGTVAVHDLLPRENQRLENVLKRVASLNDQLDFGTEFITSDTKNSTKVIFADVFGEIKKPTYKGFIATLDDSVGSDAILVLEPYVPLSDEEMEILADKYVEAIPEFNTVELDQDVELEGESYEQNVLPEPATQAVAPAKTVRVAVLDSGIDKDHAVFAHTSLQSGWNTVDENSDLSDDIGHGTHIAGIISLNSSNVEIVPYKVVGKNGGRLSDVLKALQRAMDDKVEVVNMSFGFSKGSAALQDVLDDLDKEGVTFIAAAGNKNNSVPFYPAHYDDVIAVAATDVYGNKLPKSNFGDWVDVAAYGNNIYSAAPGQKYQRMSGTSQATAVVTAKFVDYLQKSSNRAEAFQERLSGFLDLYSKPIEKGSLKGMSFISSI